MKKKTLQKLVKEQVASLLTEKFASKKITDMYRKITGGKYSTDKKFWGAASKAYGIEWDKVTDDMVSGPTGRMTRKGFEFLLAAKDMVVRGSGRYDYGRTIKKGQILSATYNGKAIYFGRSGVTTGAASAGTYPEYIGLNVMGFKNADQIIKKLPGKVEVYQIDVDKARGAKGKRQGRSDARAGATALMDFNVIKRKNQARYEKALTDRLAKSSPVDQAWKMVEATQKMINDALKKDLDMLKKGKAKDSWRSSSSILQNAYNNMTRSITNILSNENAAIKGAEKDKANKLKSGDKQSWSEEKYYLDRIVEEARSIQKEYKEMKMALSKINKDREYISVVRELKKIGQMNKNAPKADYSEDSNMNESAEKGLKAIPGVLSFDIEQFLKKQKDAKKLTKGSFTDLVKALHSRGFGEIPNGANLRNWKAVVKKHIKESNVNESKKQLKEEYIEIMRDLDKGLALVKDSWLDWKRGPMTEPSDIKPAQKELIGYIAKWIKKNIK
tara:strand:+ start:2953 stop:4452 length:1500 start_codon:yes stop_codon:yes gene_type:complete